jgi:hypothetical protein
MKPLESASEFVSLQENNSTNLASENFLALIQSWMGELRNSWMQREQLHLGQVQMEPRQSQSRNN